MDDALDLITANFGGVAAVAAMVAVGGAGLTLGAINWGTPYLKKFFKKVAS